MNYAAIFGATLLIAGTTIGAGMLAIPVSTAVLGFFPTLLVFLICWAFMLVPAFYVLDVSLALGHHVNFISMTRRTLGNTVTRGVWLLYLLLFYALLSAYMVGSGPLLGDLLQGFGIVQIPHVVRPFMIAIVFMPLLLFGMKVIDIFNRFLMLGMGVAYFLLVYLISSHIKLDLLLQYDLHVFPASFAVIVTAFGYHVLIPSLVGYLNYDRKALRMAIICGSLLPLLIYSVWELCIIGSLPAQGENSLLDLASSGESIAHSVAVYLQEPFVVQAVRYFSIFAIVTSFLGVGIALMDFWRDALLLSGDYKARFLSCALAFVPPFFIAWAFPTAFVVILRNAGVIVAILVVILPVLMKWKVQKRASVLGALVILFSFFVTISTLIY